MTNEEAIAELKYAQAMCEFDPSTGETGFRNDEDRRQHEAFGEAIKALEQPPSLEWDKYAAKLWDKAIARGRREGLEKAKDLVDAEVWAYCDYLLRKYKGGSPEAEGASALASNIRERIDDELEKEDKT